VGVAITIVVTIVYFALLAFFILMWVRFIFDWTRALRPGWRPRSGLLVVAEATYTVTDPPVRLVRRVVPPLRLGAVALDLSGTIVMLAVIVLMYVVRTIAALV
jgi:YggT family protein